MKPNTEIIRELDSLALQIDKLIGEYHDRVGGGKLEIELHYVEQTSGQMTFMSSDIIHETK